MAAYEQLDPILSRYFDGSINDAELAQLESAIVADPQFTQYVARWCVMHQHIGDLLTERILHQLMDQFATGTSSLRQEILSNPAKTISTASKPLTSPPSPVDKMSWLSAAGVWKAAFATAALIIVALSFNVWHRAAPHPDITAATAPPTSSLQESNPSGRVATLTQLVDARWMLGAPEYHHGQQFVKGNRIALESGMAKITYDCGAEIVLEGPCEFIARDNMVGYLKSGKITADVPRRAFAFAILSPEVDFVDLGTSFGLNVGDSGHAELHVFRGEVLCSRSAPEERASKAVYHVTANKAVEFGSAKDVPSDIAMNEEQFAEHFNLRRGNKSQTTDLPGGHLALWLAADNGVTTDTQQRVISWQDILYGDNQSGEDAIQVEETARPTLIKNALSGQPAIRFDGNSDYLLTTPLATTDDQTVVFVCQFSASALDKSRRWGGQIINYDGPPSRYLSDTLEPGVLQIGEPLLENEFKPTLLTAQVFAGFIGSATVESGRVDATPVGIDTPIIVTYRYDLTNGRATFSVNGHTCTETRAFAPQAITSRKIIGRHAWMENFFHGDLAELLIFNKALSPTELNQTVRYLAGKYAIKLDNAAGGDTTPQ